MTEAYCVKCKKKTEMKDAHEVTVNDPRVNAEACSRQANIDQSQA